MEFLTNGSIDELVTKYIVHIAVGSFLILFFTTLKVVFGSYWIPTIIREYKECSSVRKKYFDLFSTRDNYAFHIAWAKSRNDIDECKRMMKELKKVDEKINEIERENGNLIKGKRS